MQLKGRSAVVTGAGSGLGRAVAHALHQCGAYLTLVDQAPDSVKAAAAALGAGAATAVADVCDADQVGAALRLARDRFGPIHIVVNCAGVASAMKTVSNGAPHDLDVWRRVIDINLNGTFNVLRLAAAQMVSNQPDRDTGERGVIINTASIAAFDGQRGQAAYAASKAGVVGLTLPVARDLSDHAIRCVAIAPGLFDTAMKNGLSDKTMAALQRGLLYPDRLGDPKDFAHLVRHVIENSYLNGACVRLDGGARLPGPR